MDQIKDLVPAEQDAESSDGVYHDPDELWAAIQSKFDKSDDNRKRWHLADPIEEGITDRRGFSTTTGVTGLASFSNSSLRWHRRDSPSTRKGKCQSRSYEHLVLTDPVRFAKQPRSSAAQ